MAHLVQSMFSVKETPWHGLGHIVKEAPTAAEAIKLAGLDWQVVEVPLYREMGQDFGKIASHKMLQRSDNEWQLGVVGSGYTPLQNSDAFEFFNPFVDSGLATFETAGALRDGKTIWILARLNKAPIDIGSGDIVDKYLLLSNGHDGLMAVRTGFTPIRVVCANTLAASHGSEGSQLIRMLHSQKVKENLIKVREIVNAADAKFEATGEQFKHLARHDVNQADLEKYVRLIFPVQSIDEERRKIAEQKKIEAIQNLFETGYGADLKVSRGTYWGLYNAVTQYLSYEKGNNESSRLNSLWFGDSSIINQKALKLAVEMAV